MTKLMSRKLGVAIATLILTHIQTNQDAPWYALLAFAVTGGAYMLGQAYVDGQSAGNADEAIGEILSAVRAAARSTDPNSTEPE